MESMQKVIFSLEQDGSGYPPAESESLWAVPLGNGKFRIDNIPFYVVGISSDDEVVADENGDGLAFRSLAKKSGNSTFRLLLTDPKASGNIRQYLAKLGCTSEFNQLVGVVAVEVPASVEILPFLSYITRAKELGEVDIEEGALRHKIDG